MNFRIKLPIFNVDCEFYIGVENIPTYYKALVKEGYKGTQPENVDSKGLAWGSYVYLKDMTDDSNIAHELVHLVTNILEDRGVECDETRAYITGYLTGKFYKKAKELKEKEKNDAYVQL